MLMFNFKTVLSEGFWKILIQKSQLPVTLSFSVIDAFIFARRIVVLSRASYSPKVTAVTAFGREKFDAQKQLKTKILIKNRLILVLKFLFKGRFA